MKILFINPEISDKSGYTKEDLSFIGFPSSTAPVLAALTPVYVEFEAIDEAIEPLKDFDAIDADIIALSVNMTYKANRAAEIARKFKKRGKIVVWGGVHVTSLFNYHKDRFEEEIAPFANSVVLGEAEEVWYKLIRDIGSGQLKKIYRAANRPLSEIWPIPKYEVVNTASFLVKHSRQATRGCPLNCEFCSVTSFNGSSFRKRNAKIVANDIRQALEQKTGRNLNFIEKAKTSFFAFVDDNIGFDRVYFSELLMELIEVKRDFPNFSWGGQTTLYTIDKKVRHKGIEYDLGDLMKRSGCIGMFVGIESVSKESLATAGKNFNDVDEYPDQIKKWHDHGIMLNAGMVVGFDTDKESVFSDIYEFLVKNRVEISLLNILVPLPGTELYKRYAKEGRIFDHNWQNYDGRHVVYYPELMTPEQLENGFFNLWKDLYSTGSIIKRILYPAQIIFAFRQLPNFTKFGQLISRVYMNRRYAQISGRISRARKKMSEERFWQNISFKNLRVSPE